MTFSICHTSARPEAWRAIYDAWLSTAVDASEVEYCLVCDRRWGFTELPTLRPQDKVLWNEGRRCYVDGVNAAAAVSTGGILIVNADDQYPCEAWDLKVLQVVAETGNDALLSEEDFVVEVSTQTPTEHERGILVAPILSRGRYDRFGWIFFPSFESMYADNDFCAMAKCDNCIINARHLVFPHKHWINQQREADAVDAVQNRAEAYQQGKALFEARKAINFSGIPPRETMRTVSGAATDVRRIVCTCTPGEVFSSAWKNSWDYLFANLLNKYNVIPMNGHTTDVGMTRTLFANAVLKCDPQPEFVLWIDDDNMLSFEQFEMLMADLDAHPELSAVVGWCWIISHDLEMTMKDAKAKLSCGQLVDVESQDGELKFCKPKAMEYAELMAGDEDLKSIGYSGFPVVLVRTELLRTVGANAFVPLIDSRYEFGKSGEDITFFGRAGVRGAKFAVDRRVQVPHLKLMPVSPSPHLLEKHLSEAVTVMK